MEKRINTETITLGSGDLYCKLFTGTVPTREQICIAANLLGRIKGGASIEYKPSYYTAKDDSGAVEKTVLTDEEVLLKSGIITWNGKTLKYLCSVATVTEADGIRTVKIGGAGKDEGKKYVFCFHHHDPEDGDVWVTIIGNNQAGFVLAFAKDKETTIDAEIKASPLDEDGTLIIYEEEMTSEEENSSEETTTE